MQCQAMARHRQATVTFRAVVSFGRNPCWGCDRTNYDSLFSSAEFRTSIRKGCSRRYVRDVPTSYGSDRRGGSLALTISSDRV
eukprot:scaffold192566_cov78-Attheya_sp.AAC.1